MATAWKAYPYFKTENLRAYFEKYILIKKKDSQGMEKYEKLGWNAKIAKYWLFNINTNPSPWLLQFMP